MTALARPRPLRISTWIFALAMGLGPTLAATPARALPVISEVLYDGPGADDGQSFVELYGDPGTPLDGLVLEGVNGSNGAVGPVVELFEVIPDDGVFVVADDVGDGTSLVPAADLIANFDLCNPTFRKLERTSDYGQLRSWTVGSPGQSRRLVGVSNGAAGSWGRSRPSQAAPRIA